MKIFKNKKSKILFIIMGIVVVVGYSLVVYANTKESRSIESQESVSLERWLPELHQAAEVIDVVPKSGTDTAVGDLAARSLQGLINKTQPRIYIAEDWYRETIDVEQLRQKILEVYGERKLNQLELDKNNETNQTFWTLYKKYGNEVKMLYIYDKTLPDSINVAVMLAGRNKGIAVDSELAGQLADYGLASEDVVKKYGFTDHIQVNQWIKDNMITKSNNKTVFVLNPRGRDEHSDFLPQAYDLAIATDSLIIHLNPYLKSEVALQTEILDRYPSDTLVIGWAGADVEGDFVKSISSAGKSVVCTDWGYANGSLWGGFQKFISSEKQPAIPEEYQVSDNTTYVAFCVSDGDAWHYSARDLLSFWNQEVRGSVPIGWTIPALFSEASPLMLRYLYNTKSDADEFIQGPSGYGYVYAGKMPEEAYDSYLKNSKLIMTVMGLNMVNYWDLSTGNNSMIGDNIDIIKKYATEVSPAAIFRGHDGDGSYYMDGETAIIQEVGNRNGAGTKSAQDIIDAVKRVEEKTIEGEPAFVMVNVEAWGDGVSSVQAAVAELNESGGNYVFVKPSELVAAVKTYSKEGATLKASEIALPDQVQTVSFLPDGSKDEKKYMLIDKSTGLINDEFRFADNNGYWVYAIPLSGEEKYPRLEVKLQGQYQISTSRDGELWTVLRETSGIEAEATVYIDLRKVLEKDQKILYIKFSDAVPENGFGPSLKNFRFVG